MQMQDIPYKFPDAAGHFGPYGGSFVAETLMPALAQLREAYEVAQNDAAFQAEFHSELKHYVGRPSPIYHAKHWSSVLGGAQIYLKREDLAHTGAHKINNALGQALLVKRMGKKRIVAETGAGQHGVASATAAALLGLECVVYMGSVDIARQEPNVFRMKLLSRRRPVPLYLLQDFVRMVLDLCNPLGMLGVPQGCFALKLLNASLKGLGRLQMHFFRATCREMAFR